MNNVNFTITTNDIKWVKYSDDEYSLTCFWVTVIVSRIDPYDKKEMGTTHDWSVSICNNLCKDELVDCESFNHIEQAKKYGETGLYKAILNIS